MQDVTTQLATLDVKNLRYNDTEWAFQDRVGNLGDTLRTWVESAAFTDLIQRAQAGGPVTFDELCQSFVNTTDFYIGDADPELVPEILTRFLIPHSDEDTPSDWGGSIQSMEGVRKQIRTAIGLLGLQIVVTTTGSVAGLLGAGTEGSFAAFTDPLNLLDVPFMILFAVGLKFRSRVAAVSLLLFSVGSRLLIMATEGGGLFGLLLTLVIFGRAAEACFAHHRLMRDADLNYKPSPVPAIIAVVAGLVLSPCVVLAGIGVFALPEGLVEGSDINDENLVRLHALGLIPDTEFIEAVYYTDSFDLEAGGVLITPNFVLTWEEGEDGVRHSSSIRRDAILSTDFLPADSMLDDVLVVVESADDTDIVSFYDEDAATAFIERVSPAPPP